MGVLSILKKAFGGVFHFFIESIKKNTGKTDIEAQDLVDEAFKVAGGLVLTFENQTDATGKPLSGQDKLWGAAQMLVNYFAGQQIKFSFSDAITIVNHAFTKIDHQLVTSGKPSLVGNTKLQEQTGGTTSLSPISPTVDNNSVSISS